VVEPQAGDNLGRDPYAGTVNRAGLVTIVDQGLGRFLGRLRLSPVVEQGRFVGFGVTGIDPSWGDVGLRPGDVIMRVNGQPIERPEQALAVFEGLRLASEIAVDLTRDGVPATLRFRVD
jgi:type II secretory pathway component PulC